MGTDWRGEADEVVHDDVDRAAHGVSPQVGEIERFRPDALAGESGVAMHHDGDDLVRSFPRTVKVGAAQPVTRLLGARAADCNGIDSFQMARIRHEVHPDFFAGAGNVGAGGADVVFHVARAEHAARIYVLEPSHDFMRALARGVHHDVQAATMTHGHDGRLRAVFPGRVQDGIEQGNKCRDAFQRKSLRTEIPRLQDLFEKVGANQPLEDLVRVNFFRGSFDSLNDPAAAFRLGQMHEVGANGATVDATSLFGQLAGKTLKVRVLERLENAQRI